MWLLSAFATPQAPNATPANVAPPYWPLGPQPAVLNRPIGTLQRGGESATLDRYSVAAEGYNDDPPYVETYTRHISQVFPGVDGRDMWGSYAGPYDKVVALYTQPGQRSVPAWQNPENGPDHRSQLRAPALGSSNIPVTPALTRPLVLEADYTLQSLTSDSAMLFQPGDIGWSGPDWNAY